VSGGEHKTKKVVLKGDKVHPSVERAVKIIKESFQKLCLEDQDILGKSTVKESIQKLFLEDQDILGKIIL
jgi:hypothetical protein